MSRIDGVMVTVSASKTIDHWLEPRSGPSKNKKQKKKTKKERKKKKKNIYESRIKLIFFNFTFFTFQMNNIFSYLKKELIIQHACVV
jgi:hypothetical protein